MSWPGFTEEPGRITRPLATPALAGAMARVREWMIEAGLEPVSDAIGNLVGRRGPGPRLIIGSHLDSVADAGRYDGILGVLVGLEVAAATDVPLEVVAFADEEGLRFQSTFLGSRAYVGAITPEEEAMVGIELGEPLFDGAYGYLEVHIEQGPVLVGRGRAARRGHGDLRPVALQRRLQRRGRARGDDADGDARATRWPPRPSSCSPPSASPATRTASWPPSGELRVPHGACNVVPGRVELTLDVRHADDVVRADAVATLQGVGRPGIDVSWAPIHHHEATPGLARRCGRSSPRRSTGGPSSSRAAPGMMR